jgi:SAM-dependent methyltransferase
MTDSGSPPPSDDVEPVIDASVPHSARVWNYWLGGKDNYPVDREAGEEMRTRDPDIIDKARAARGFLRRAVRYLAGEAGVRQFLDIGTGLPTAENTHEIAQRVAPESRVVYVDNDPVVLAHARALLTSTQGATAYIDADLHDPGKILEEAARTLNFAQPVAIMLVAIMHHVADDDEAYAIVNRLLEAVPSGSYLAIAHATAVVKPDGMNESVRYWNEIGSKPGLTVRTPEQIARFFDGLELLEPGVVSYARWRPEPSPSGIPAELDGFAGVGRKP